MRESENEETSVQPKMELPPTPAGRKAFLQRLVPQLRLDEVRFLQTQLARLDLRTDVFGRLPAELQMMVADRLAADDVASCLDVSRSWRQAFLGEGGLLRGLARRCFPGVVEYAAVATEVARSSEEAIFARVARRYARRSRGRFRGVFRHCRDVPVAAAAAGLQRWQEQKEQEEDDERYTLHEYAHGRLLWQRLQDEQTLFLLDDLRTGQRFHLEVPNSTVRGEMYVAAALGDELVVASTDVRVLAWDFATGTRETKRMPAQIDVVATLGRRVCVLAQGHIYGWTFGGGPVRAVDLAGLDGRHRQPDRDGRLPSFLLLDPLQPDVLYLGNYSYETDAQGRNGCLWFFVHECRDRRYCCTYTHCLPFADSSLSGALIETAVRCDSRGRHALATWRVMSAHPSRRGPVLRPGSGSGFGSTALPTYVAGVGSLAFDMYSKTFSRSYFHLEPLLPPPLVDGLAAGVRPTPTCVHLWNDQLLTLVDRHAAAASGKVVKAAPLLFALDEASADEHPVLFSDIPVYVSVPAVPGALQRRRRVAFHELFPASTTHWKVDNHQWAKTGCRLRYALDLDTMPRDAHDADDAGGAASAASLARRPPHIAKHQLVGDDDFLVLHHADQYTVWAFADGATVRGTE